MAITTKELKEKRANLSAQARELLNKATEENRDLTAEEDSQFNAIHADCEKLRNQYERMEKQEKLDRELAEAERSTIDRTRAAASAVGNPDDAKFEVTEADRALSLQAWMRCQMGLRISKSHKAAVDKTKCNLRKKELDVRIFDSHRLRQFRNAQSVSTPSGGGFLVPEGFVANLETARLQYGAMFGVGDVLRTDSGGELLWPTANDTGNVGALIGENVAQDSQDVAFGAKSFHAYKYSSKLVLISMELLEDSAFDMASQIGAMIGERLGRIGNLHLTTGDGAAKPEGIVTGSTNGVTAASASAFTTDEVFNLIHSVDPAYRGMAKLMMSDSTFLVLQKLKNGSGEYLFNRNINAGAPNTFNGYQIIINQDMPTIATGAKVMVFGEMSKYKIREVRSVRIVRLVERYAEFDQEGFVAFMRWDGGLIDAGTHPVKHLAMG